MAAISNAVNGKMEQLTATLEGLTIEDETRGLIARQLGGIMKQVEDEKKKVKVKVRDLEPFDGETGKLRSWITAAQLNMDNKGVEGDDDKIKFIGGHLKGKAWDWVEPILREKDALPRDDWSERTTRVLGSYKEFRKALNQVFGETNERKIAADKLQKLYQVRSVTEYITNFQTITSSLDWDEEALEDKFMQGLKPQIQDALIYFPKEPDNLEELFERAQKIDRNWWRNQEEKKRNLFIPKRPKRENWNDNQWNRNRFERKTNRNGQGESRWNQFERKPMKTDRDGDIVMTGAKVSSEEARKGNLCYNCGKKGHFARNCRNRKESGRLTQRNGRQGTETLKMVREIPEERSIGSLDLENQEREQVDVSSIFRKLSLEDLDTSDSDDMPATSLISLKEPNRKHFQEKDLDTEGQGKETLEVPGEQTDGLACHSGTQMDATAPRVIRRRGGNSTTVRKFTDQQREPESLEESLATVNFSKMTKTREPYWKEYCSRRETITDNYEKWQGKIQWQMDNCNCYDFNPKCWAGSERTWNRHISECEECKNWESKKCKIFGHSKRSKNNILNDISLRKHIPGNIRKSQNGKTCCEMNLCTHEFYEHGKYDIPWWACYEASCSEHLEMKSMNEQWPEIPLITVKKAQECPCFREGCTCNYSIQHPFRTSLVQRNEENSGNIELKTQLEQITAEIREITRKQQERDTQGIKKTSQEDTSGQLKVNVKIGKTNTMATIDCGADFDYVNKEWCKKQGFRIRDIGKGRVKGFDGKSKEIRIEEAEIQFRIQGKFLRQKFRILEETGEDEMVLGIPWLEKYNPEIDWKKRTMSFTTQAKRESGSDTERLALRQTKEPGISPEAEDGRGGYNNKEYQEELEEIKGKLPKEIQEFADIFTTKK